MEKKEIIRQRFEKKFEEYSVNSFSVKLSLNKSGDSSAKMFTERLKEKKKLSEFDKEVECDRWLLGKLHYVKDEKSQFEKGAFDSAFEILKQALFNDFLKELKKQRKLNENKNEVEEE